MTEEYNSIVANHYAAYRPPIHHMILRRVLPSQETYGNGLDIGCGTGYSTVALTEHCEHVYGVDPSPSMLSKATKHERIRYLTGAGDCIPLLDNSVDLVTFAGSLFYAKNEATFQELKRVCRKGAIVIVYDFEILLEDSLLRLGVGLPDGSSNYNHALNLSDVTDFTESLVRTEKIQLAATAPEFAHILLSNLDRYNVFVKKYGVNDPFSVIVRTIESTEKEFPLQADVYYAKYLLL